MMTGEWQNMKNETWLTELEFAACLMAVAVVAVALMVGHTLWMSLARK